MEEFLHADKRQSDIEKDKRKAYEGDAGCYRKPKEFGIKNS